ncbi:MAG: tetratricopeptide repeat protein [Streptomyces sp.]|nr:tetratricopeptide repeat protein [Streptomyces sp.]
MTGTGQRFFISYAGVDRPWAEWVAWHLERGGHRTILDVWDWRTGDDFVRRMDEALERADAVVALFSKAYFEDGRWTGDEWSNAVARRDRFIPLAIEPLTNDDVRPLLASRIRKDLHGLEEEAAVAALREAVNGGRRPTEAPPLPVPEAEEAAVTEVVAVGAADKPRLPGSTGRPDVWNVRRRNLDFSGREAQIADLRDGLLGGEHSVVYALHGMGGIGKTQLALEYAHRFAGQYDLVWWIDAEQADQIPVHYTELADRLGIAVKEAGAEHNARMLVQHLSGRSRWLVILDNAEDPHQVERWLPDGPGHVLITSRNPNWRRLARPTSLDVFARADSLAYFRTRVPGIGEADADVLARELGDLPLALAQAADMIERGTHVDLYLRLLHENTSPVLREGEVPDYPEPLAAAVAIAVEDLDGKHPDAAALLRLAAFLGPDPIPTEWLVDARERLSTIPAQTDALTWMRTTLEPLRRNSLVRIDGSGFQVHRLTQAVLRDQVDPARKEAIRDDVAAVLASVTPGDPETPGHWSAWASLTSHLVSQHIDIHHRPELRATLHGAVNFLIRSAQPRAAAELAGTLRDTWTAQLGRDHPDVLTATQFLGHATSDLGDIYGARPIIEDTHTRRRATLGDDHPDTLQSANDLAAIHTRLGLYSVAHAMHQDTLDRRRHVLGDDHPDTLQSAANFAASLYRMGGIAAARELDEDTLARRRRVLGEDHPETLRSALQLGEVCFELGEVTEAHRMHTEAWERCRTALGDNHPVTLGAAGCLANTLAEMGRDEAKSMIEDALDRCRRIYGESHPDSRRATYTYACVMFGLNNHEEARRILVDLMALQRSVLGRDHAETLVAMNQLALTLSELRQYTEAVRLLEDVVAWRSKAYGEDHPETLKPAFNLGAILYEARSFQAAAAVLEDVLARRRGILGDGHKDTQKTVQVLTATYKRMGQNRKAQKLTAKKSTKSRFRKKSR